MQQLDFSTTTQDTWDRIALLDNFKTPFLTYQWHHVWFKILGQAYTPFILLTDNQCVAPFARSGNRVIFSGGYEIADYLDIVGQNEAKLSAWEEIIAYLKGQHVSTLELGNIPQDSPTLEFFKNKTEIKTEDTTPILELPKTWDEYQNNLDKKYRHELQRKIRKFEREFSEIDIEENHTDPQIINEFFRLMKLNPNKAEFLTAPMEKFFRALIETFNNSIELLVLKVGSEIAGATLSFFNPTTIFLYNSGFDETNYSGAGFYLKAMAIKRALGQGKQKFNFLQGNERYKYELGGKDFGVYSLTYNLN